MSQQDANLKKGVSPWQDAWRRLKKNKMAMFGLWAVVGMSLISIFGPMLPGVPDPNVQFNFVGAQPAMSRHVYVQNKNSLAIGQVPQLPPGYASKTKLEFGINMERSTEYRVVVRRRKVSQIVRELGAKPYEQLKASDKGDYFVEDLGGGKLGQRLPAGFLVQVDEKLPPSLEGKRVFILRHVFPAQRQDVLATLSAGKVTQLELKGAADDEELAAAGPPTSLAFDGRDVVSALADGEPQTILHVLGTDSSGRDLMSRVISGGRISLMVGLVATLVSLLIGVVYGAVSGYYGGRLDALLMGFVDVLYGIPYLFLVILLMTFFSKSLVTLFIALGAVQWLTMARIVRGQILSLKQKEFVEAARMCGSSDFRIVFEHLIPNTLGVVVVYTTLTVPAVILQESFLAFLGLTVEWAPGETLESWGALVNSGVKELGDNGERSWLLLWPSAAMALTLFSLNFLGDGLRDALDPQQRGKT